MQVTCGIPQVSILGPLFYTIYTNELPSTIEDKLCQEPVYREKTSLFPNNCRKCGSVPSFADDPTFATTKIKYFLNSQELVVNLTKTTLLESMVKQKRSRLRDIQPSLATATETGDEKIIFP